MEAQAQPQANEAELVLKEPLVRFSAGGTISLRYAEHCNEKPDKFPIKPKGVFTVDSPLDLFDIWEYFQREIKKIILKWVFMKLKWFQK